MSNLCASTGTNFQRTAVVSPNYPYLKAASLILILAEVDFLMNFADADACNEESAAQEFPIE